MIKRYFPDMINIRMNSCGDQGTYIPKKERNKEANVWADIIMSQLSGNFNSQLLIMPRASWERNMVKVAVQILGRATPVELDFMQIEKT